MQRALNILQDEMKKLLAAEAELSAWLSFGSGLVGEEVPGGSARHSPCT